ncbi:MAG: penicillin-binding protein [Bryobacteraceae bacterium]
MQRVDAPPGTPRLRWLARLLLAWALVIAGRLVYLQAFAHDRYTRLARIQHEKLLEVKPVRGPLLDRNGNPLALSLAVDSVCVNPQRVDAEFAALVLSRALNLDRTALQRSLEDARRRRQGFLWIKRKMPREESDRLRGLKLSWIELRRESLRVYPKGPLAAHLLGSVGLTHRSGDEEIGTSGIEQALEPELRGRPGRLKVYTDSARRNIESKVSVPAQPGAGFCLTIDQQIQYTAERALRRGFEAGDFTTGTIVVMEPQTGDVLALANWPSYDPNETPRSRADLDRRINLGVTTPFEPGSVFKIITVAAALETTNLQPSTIVPCGNGSIQLYGQTIRDTKSYGALSMADVLAKSSNIGAIQIALRVGERRLLSYIQKFGFGRLTAIPLPGESAGLVRELPAWRRSSIGYVAMGHEISATSVQLAQATAAIANGGMLVKPRLLRCRETDGRREELPAEAPVRVIRAETSITMRHMMEGVVLRGTGGKARLPGYSSGGKTGSAQIFDFKTRKYLHIYNASFAGFAPVNRPAVVVVVNLHGAKEFGGAVAAPLFRDVASSAVRLMGVRRDIPDLAPPSAPEDVTDLAIAGAVAPPEQEAAAPSSADTPVDLIGPRMPDFRGKSVRAVLSESMELGMQVEVLGSGLARAQSPAAGSVVPAGGRIKVQFAR